MTATDLALPVLGGARVLVAAGDPDGSAAMTAMLRLNGFDAREARTEPDVLQALAEDRPRVMVMDFDLPCADPCALIRRVRREVFAPSVVVVTGHTAPGVRRAAEQAGAAAYLLKPTEPTDLARLVWDLCAAG